VNAPLRVRALWESVRPRTRRGTVLGVIGVLAGAVVLSAVLFVGAVMAWSPYLDFSLNRDSDARNTAALKETFADTGICAACHLPEAQKLSLVTHAGIGCQSCHGPLLAHSLASPGTTGATGTIAVPTDDVCVRCHVQAVGRPAAFRQIVPTVHYVSTCLQCHDPHTGIARRPPIVEHPLANLPPCLTCHGSDGFKQRNQRHPAGSSDDKPCLDCHASGRGPAESPVP
jgi:Cytochrome c554 and c-prime